MSKRKFIKVRMKVTFSFFNQPKIPLGEERVFEIPNIAAQEKQAELEKWKRPPEYVPREGTIPRNYEIRLNEIEGGTVPRWRFHGHPSGEDY